jgi:uncharacterized membrane protein YoaK (UPF0700 family)
MQAVLLTVLLAVSAGWVDTVVYFALGLFSAHVTGNIVLMFDALRRAGPGVVMGAIAVPVFIVVAWLAALLGELLGPKRRVTLVVLFALETVLLAACLVLGLGARNADKAELAPVLAGMLGVAAMAVQNATNRLLPSLPSTAVMTSNVSQMVVDLAIIVRPGEERAKAAERLRRFVPAVLGFAAGCAGAAGAYAVIGVRALAVPVVLLAVTACFARPEKEDVLS